MIKNTLLFLFVSTLIMACQSNEAPDQSAEAVKVTNEAPSKTTQAIATAVNYQPIEKKSMVIHTTATGILKPFQQTTLHIKSSGTIEQLPIQEGQLVQKGDLIAALNGQALTLTLEQTKLELQEAIVNKKDLLIANGGVAEIDTSVTPEKLDLILTLSGYRRAAQGIRQAEFQLAQAQIYAPFTGVVADLKVKQYQQGNTGQEICRLLNPNTFEAEFQLTEAEALRIQLGQTVQVLPLAMPEKPFRASISIINPVVNAQGLVTVRARLTNTQQQRLLEGMNVKVQIERKIPPQLVIPKTALVLRSGKTVVFTYHEKEKLAKWNYVTVGEENEAEVAVVEGLKVGDWVIFEGNMNLSHDADVVMKKE